MRVCGWMCQHRDLWLCLFCWLSLTSTTQAAGMYLPVRGAYAISRGGASIAGGDTLHTLWYNPANLVEHKGLSTLVEFTIVHTDFEFSRAPRQGEEGRTINYAPVSNEAPPFPMPSLMISYQWEPQRVAVAFGVYSPYASPMAFPDTGPQRYTLVNTNGSFLLMMHLAAAWSPHPRFRIGVGLQNYVASITLIRAASGYLGAFGAPEDRDLDLYTEARLQSYLNITGNVGAWGRLVDTQTFKLDLGTSVQLPTYMSTTGTIKVRLPTHPMFDSASVEGDQVRSELWFPFHVRVGLRASFAQRANVEFAFTYDTWEYQDKLGFSPEGEGIWVNNVSAVGRYQVAALEIPRNFQNTYSIRIGSAFDILLDLLEARLGYTFESNAIPDQNLSVFTPDANKHMVGAGVTFTWKRQHFDLTYAVVLYQDRDITNSEDKQLNPLNPKGAIVVSNGSYRNTVHLIGLAWRGQF